MAVNSPLPIRAQLTPVPGLQLGYAQAGIKKPGRKDLLVLKLAPAPPWRAYSLPIDFALRRCRCRKIISQVHSLSLP